jgi:PAS domain S-box-containing protein
MPAVWLDARGRIVKMNGASCDLLDVAGGFLKGRPVISIIDPEDRHDIVQFLIDANSAREGSLRREVQLLAGDGPRTVDLGLAYIDDCDEAGFILQLHDMTEQRATESALRQSEVRYRQFFEGHTVAMYRVRPSGEILEANHAMAALAGYPHPKYLVSLNVATIYVRPSDRAAARAELDRVGRLDGRDFELARPDGSTVWVRDFSKALTQPDGAIIYEGALFDVTQRYMAETQLRNRALQQASVSALGQLALQSHDPHAVSLSAVRIAQEGLNMDGVALLRGENLKVYTRWDRRELTGTLLDRLDPTWMVGQVPESQEATVVSTPFGGFVALLPVQDVHGATGLLAAASMADPELNNDDIHFFQAISSVIAATLERAESRGQLERLVSSKDEFIASISHEVRTPLTVAMGISHELQDRWRDIDDDERDELLRLVVDQTQDMSDLVEDLLVAARADIGKLPIHVEPMAVGPALAAAVSSVRMPHHVEIEVSDHNPTCYADPVRFRQIIRNLLTNAIRYGGDSVRIDIRHDNERVWIDVADSGEGVAFESRETIFEAYERAHRSVGLPGSVGLGLTVSRRLARLMDGDLTYRYDDDSVFTLELAVAPALMFWNGSTG